MDIDTRITLGRAIVVAWPLGMALLQPAAAELGQALADCVRAWRLQRVSHRREGLIRAHRLGIGFDSQSTLAKPHDGHLTPS